MRSISIVAKFLLLVSAILLSTASADGSGRWFLSSRHGECVELRTLNRKIPGIGNIEDPQSFILFMEGKGHTVIAEDLTASGPKEFHGNAVHVSIPEEELSLLFVKESLCQEFIDL